MNNIIRKEALEWWNKLPWAYKADFSKNHFGFGRPYTSLTGREIEAIYRSEVFDKQHSASNPQLP